MTGKNISDQISIEVNGRVFRGWKSAQVVSNLNQLATQFTLSITRDFPGDGFRIRPGDLAKILIGDDLVATGFVDKTPVSYTGKSVTTTISGRSRTADLVDCCILTEIKAGAIGGASSSWADITHRADGKKVAAAKPASQWKTIDLKSTISSLVAPYGVSLIADDDGEEKIVNDVSVSKGTTVFNAIKKLVQDFNYIATDTPSGDVRLVSVDTPEQSSSTLRVSATGEGTNVLEGSAAFDYSSVYTDYEVFGQAKPVKTSTTPDKEHNIKASATSAVLGSRFRLLRIFQSGNATLTALQERALYEAATRAGKAKTIVYKVNGWRQPNGDLWKKGVMITVNDDVIGIKQRMMIGKVTFDLNASGQTTTLEIAPRGAFNVAKSDKWNIKQSTDKSIGATSTEANREQRPNP